MSLVKFQETDILLDELVELSVVSCNQNPHWRNVLFVLGLGLNERLKDLALNSNTILMVLDESKLLGRQHFEFATPLVLVVELLHPTLV